MILPKILSTLFQPTSYKNLNRIEVSRSALVDNYEILRQHCEGMCVAPVLKSNAYGHGIKSVAAIFDSLAPPFLVVDSLFEAYQLQQLALKTPILVMGYTHPDNLRFKRLPFHFSVFDLDSAIALNQSQQKCQIHVFVDTGMNREGVALADLREFLGQVALMRNLEIVGLASHLADADNPGDSPSVAAQLSAYTSALKIAAEAGLTLRWRHLSASAGALLQTSIQMCNMVRVGLASYGVSPLQHGRELTADGLRPALRFISTLAQIKTVPAGQQVGYNGTFTVSKSMRLGLVPAGYYDGVDRRLSNCGVVYVRGVLCPIVGRVSMNMTTIDISAVKDAHVGDVVEIYGTSPQALNSIAHAAKLSKTIPYDLLVHLAESVKREVVG